MNTPRKVKIKRKKVTILPKILPKLPVILPKLQKIKKIGRWCDAYKGRLPYPIECSSNKSRPLIYIFIQGERKLVHDWTCCRKCERFVQFKSWKEGKWANVIKAIEKGEDLRGQPSPVNNDL